MSTALERLKKKADANSSGTKKREVEIQSSVVQPKAAAPEPKKEETALDRLKSKADANSLGQGGKITRLNTYRSTPSVSQNTYEAASKKSAVDSFMQRTGGDRILGAPTLADINRSTPQNFAARHAQPAPIATPTLDRLQRSMTYDPMTEPGGAAGGISMTARQEAEDREKAARKAYVDAQVRMAEVDSNPSYESLQEALSGYLGARQEYNRAETLGDTYRYLDRGYQDQVNADTFRGQIRANYVQGRIGQDSSLAWNEYLDNPTDENYIYATMLDEIQARNAENNREALDDVGTVLPAFSKDFAQYVPQRIDQIKYGAVGAVAGGLLGAAAGAAGAGIRAGITASSGVYSYQTMRGAAYKNLREMGIDDETARDLAGDEAFISSLIEMADTALDLATLGGGKLINAAAGSSVKVAAAKGAVEKLTAKLTNRIGASAAAQFVNRALSPAAKKALTVGLKFGANVLSEGMEEYSQEAVSAANEERAKAGKTTGLVGDASKLFWNTITGQDDTYKQRFNEAFRGGAVIALIGGGGEIMVNNLATGAVTTLQGKYVAKSYDGSGADQLINDAIKLQGESAETAKKLQVRMREGKAVTNYELGKLYQQVRDEIQVKKTAGENVDPVQAQEQAEDAHAQDVRAAETVAAQQEQKQAFTSQAMANGANASDVEEVTRTQAAIEEALAQAEQQTPTAEQVLGIQQDVPQAPEQVMAEAQPAPAQPLASAVPAAEEMQGGNLPVQEQRPSQAVSEAQAEAQPYIQPEVQPVRQQSVTEQDAAEIDSFVQSYGADEQAAIKSNYHGEQPVASYLKGAAELIGMVRKGVTSVTDLNYEQLGLTQAQADDIYARVRSGLDTLYANNKGNGLVKNETVGRLSTGTQKSLAAIGRALGVRIEVVEKSGTNGSFDASTNTVTIALDGQGTFKGILAHEALHVFQTRSASGYEAFRDTAVKAMMKRHGYSTEQAIIDYYVNRKGYSEDLQRKADAGRNLTQVEQDNYIKDEIAADYATELMDHEDMFRSLMNDSHSKAEAVLSYIKDVFNRLKNKLKGSEYEGDYENLRKHIAMYEQMLAEVKEKSNDEQAATPKAGSGYGIRYSAMYRNRADSFDKFYDFVIANKDNPAERDKSYYIETLDDGSSLDVFFDAVTHVEDRHSLSKDQYHEVFNSISNGIISATESKKNRGKDVVAVILKIDNPKYGKGLAVVDFYRSGRNVLRTAFFDNETRIDDWIKNNGLKVFTNQGANSLLNNHHSIQSIRDTLYGSQGESSKNNAAVNKSAAAQGAEAQTLTDGEARNSRRTAPDIRSEKRGDITVKEITDRFSISVEDAAPAVEAIKSFDGIQLEMDLAGLLSKSKVQTVFDGFKRDLIYDGGVDFVGRTFKDVNELAVAAQVFRDPRFETVRYFFIDENGTVVLNTGVSSKIPNVSALVPGADSREKTAFINDTFTRAQELGAKTVYVLHNHPSKNITPSSADFSAMRALKNIVEQGPMKFGESIIIDHNKYTLFDPDGNFTRYDDSDSVDPLVRTKGEVNKSLDIRDIAKTVNSTEDDIVLIFSNAQSKVTGIQKIAGDYFKSYESFSQYIHDEGIKFGAYSAFASAHDTNSDIDAYIQRAYENGILRDAVFGSNPSLADDNVPQRQSGDYAGQVHVAERRFSMKDSEGRKLSAEQREFFKDSKVLDEDGNLRVVYHGTDANFTVFDRTKGRSTMDIQGMFFSPWELDAEGYGSDVKAYYLNITNPAPEGTAYKALNRFKGQNDAGVKAREYLESLGYDGVNNGDEEYIAFRPEQIKLASNDKPTADPDIRFSRNNNTHYDYSKPFAEQIDDWKAGIIPNIDTLVVGPTPEVLLSIGANALPVTINQTHVDYALNGTKDPDHQAGESLLKQLPEQIKKPVAIITSATSPNTSLVMLLPFQINGKEVIAPVYIDGFGTQNNIVIDSNAITSLFGKGNAVTKLLSDALKIEAKGKNIGVYYLDNAKATRLLGVAGVPMPQSLANANGSIHSINEPNSPVKPKFNSQIETQQFKRWFGDWKKNPKSASNAVNADGTPRVLYHWTNSDFTVFDTGRSGSNQGKTHGDGIYLSTSPNEFSYAGSKRMELYANVRNPFEMQLNKKQAEQVYEKYFKPYHEDKYGTYKPHVLSKLQTPSRVFDYLNEAAEKNDTTTSHILKELGYDGVHDGSEWVVFDSTQVKSATDNIGLFDPENPDIRYSRKSSAADTKLDRRHQQEVAALKKELDYWKKQTKRTKMNVIDEKAVRKLANDTISFFGANIKAADIQQDLTQLYDILSKTELGDPEYAQADYLALDIAASVIDSVREEVPDPVWNAETRKGVKSYFSGKTITARKTYLDEAAHEFGYENYNELRKALFGKVNLVASENAAAGAASMDDVYLEVSDMFPGVFPTEENMDEATIAVNLVNGIMQAHETAETINPYEVYGGRLEAVMDLAESLINSYIDHTYRLEKEVDADRNYFALTGEAPTAADQWNWKMQDLQADLDNVNGQIKTANEEIARLKKENAANESFRGLADAYGKAVMNLEKDKASLEAELAKAKAQAEKAKARLEAQKQQDKEHYKGISDRSRARTNDRLDRQKDYYTQKILELRAASRLYKEKAIAELKLHNKEIADRARQRKEDSAQRTRLLKLARRLKNKKLDPVTKAFLNEKIGELDLVAKSITGKSRAGLESLAEWYEEQKANPNFIPNKQIEEKIARLGKVQIKSLSQQQVADLVDVLLGIEYQIETQNKFIQSKERSDLFDAVRKTVDSIRRSKGRTAGTAMTAVDRIIADNTLSPLRFVKRIVGYDTTSPLYTLTEDLNDGQRAQMMYEVNAKKPFDRFTNDKKFVRWFTGKDAEEIVIEGTAPGGARSAATITPAMRTALYLHSLNPQNLKHIASGGLKIPDIDLYKKGKYADAYANGTRLKLTRSEITGIVSQMTEQEKAFAREVRNYYNNVSKQALTETYLDLYGFEPDMVEGDYFPIHTDSDFLDRPIEAIKYDGSIEHPGWMNSRVDARNPIMLEDVSDSVNQSITQHGRFVGLAIPVNNFNKLWGASLHGRNDVVDFNRTDTQDYVDANSFLTSVKEALKQKWQTSAARYIESMLQNVQGAYPQTSQDDFSKFIRRIRTNYVQATLTANISVSVKQAASYPTAAAVLGWKPLGQALADRSIYTKQYIERTKELSSKYSPLLAYRSWGYSTTELGDVAKYGRGFTVPTILNTVQYVDILTTSVLWTASEHYVSNNTDLKKGSDEFYKATADIYNRVIEETQPNYTAMQRPPLISGNQNELLRTFFSFKTQPFQNFNIVYDALASYYAAKKAYAAEQSLSNEVALAEARVNVTNGLSAFVAAAATFSAMAFAYSLFRGKTAEYEDDDEDEITAKSFTTGFMKSMISGMMGSVPLGAELAEGLSSLIFGDRYYAPEDMALQAMSDFVSAAKKMVSLIGGLAEGEKPSQQSVIMTVRKFTEKTSALFGVPEANVLNFIGAVYYQVVKAARGKYIGRYYQLATTTDFSSNSAAYYDVLYNAMVNDEESYKYIYKQLTGYIKAEPAKIASAMEKRMKEAQGVESVTDLESRYMAPDAQGKYEEYMGTAESSGAWQNLSDEEQKKVKDVVYNIVTMNSSGVTLLDKIHESELSIEQYIEYKIRLYEADKDKNGSTNQDEFIDAMSRMDLTKAEKSRLWTSNGWKDKNNPYK